MHFVSDVFNNEPRTRALVLHVLAHRNVVNKILSFSATSHFNDGISVHQQIRSVTIEEFRNELMNMNI